MTDPRQSYLGNYRLVRVLGQGGQAQVYLGEHRYLQRHAAIKVMRASLDKKKEQQFLSEAQLLASLSHPHIVRVLEFGIEQGTPFLVMEYAPKGSLLTQFPRGSCLFLDTALEYVGQIANALQYAHDHHIIHRDIKPENLLLDAQNHVMLSDFGLALLAPFPHMMSTQDFSGTLPYMAPEQLRGKPCYASDQYALAILVYEWLCGHHPFRGSPPELIYQHCSVPPPRLRAKNTAVSDAVEAVVLKALAKDPDERYPTVYAFAQALAQAKEQSPLDRGNDPAATVFAGPPLLRLPDRHDTRKIPVPVLPAAASLAPKQRANEPERQYANPLSKNQDRQRMLARVHSFWITGFLAPSLRHKPPINLRLVEYPEAVTNPWKSVVQQPHQPAIAFPSGTHISQVYDQLDGELLILGEPGSGKTILSLELVRTLLERAALDETQPIPVIFPLSSWADQRLPLAQWLIEELHTKYQVPRRLAQTWVETNALGPVLDGLDEVTEEHRSACIEAIKIYKREHGLRPLVVCCRSEEYFAQEERLSLRSAVVPQPFTPQQIGEYLQHTGGNLKALNKALRIDPALQQLATKPLMLSTMVLTYRDRPIEDLLPLSSSQEQQQQIFAAYVEQTLKRRQPAIHYKPQQTLQWLSDLARQMKQHNQVIFYLEQMQPDWLKDRRLLWIYEWLVLRLPGFLVGFLCGLVGNNLLFHSAAISAVFTDGLMGGFIGYLFSCRTIRKPLPGMRRGGWKDIWSGLIQLKHVSNGLLIWLLIWLFHGFSLKDLIGGLCFGLSAWLLSVWLERQRSVHASKAGTRVWIQNHLSNGLLLGFACAISSKIASHTPLLVNVGYILRDGVRIGVIGILLSVILINDQGAIHPSEIISWSWRRIFRVLSHNKHVKNALQILLFLGLAYGLSDGLSSGPGLPSELANGLAFGVSYGLSIAFSYWLLLGLFQGLSSDRLDNRQRVLPNEGIQRSAWNVLLIGVISGWVAIPIYIVSNILNFGLRNGIRNVVYTLLSHKGQPLPQAVLHSFLSGWTIGLQHGLTIGLSYWWIAGLVGGLLMSLLSGGLACLRHYVLRLLLWRTGSFALNISHFLDYAAERILMRKVGGGYIFMHPLLRDYFASLEPWRRNNRTNSG